MGLQKLIRQNREYCEESYYPEHYLIQAVVGRALLDLQGPQGNDFKDAREWLLTPRGEGYSWSLEWCCEYLTGADGDSEQLVKVIRKAANQLIRRERSLIWRGSRRSATKIV